MKNTLIFKSNKNNFLLNSNNILNNNNIADLRYLAIFNSFKLFHSNSVLFMERVGNNPETIIGDNNLLNNPANIPTVDDIIQLIELVKLHKNENVEALANASTVKESYDKFEVISSGEVSSFSECFSWYLDEQGKPLDLNKQLKVFDGFVILSRYLETRLNLDKDDQNSNKLSALIKPFLEKESVTVGEFLSWIAKLHDEKGFKDFIEGLRKKVDNSAIESEILSKVLNDSGLQG